MHIEEIIRSCANEEVAEAAVDSIGRSFAAHVRETAALYDLSVGAFIALSVTRFVRHGDEGEMRSVQAAMRGSQEPVLAGLHRMLCIMLAASTPAGEIVRMHDRAPRMAAQLCVMEVDTRRAIYG